MDIDSKIQIGNVRWLILAAKNLPAPCDTYLQILNITKDQSYDALTLISIDAVNTLHNMIKKTSTTQAYALKAGVDVLVGDFGVIDYICLSSETVLSSIEIMLKYYKISVPSLSYFSFSLSKDFVSIELHFDPLVAIKVSWYEQLGVEFSFSLYISRTRRATGVDFNPITVSFKHSKPAYHKEIKKLFNAEIIYNAPSNSMTFNHEVLPLRQKYTADENMFRAFHQCADAALSNIELGGTLRHKVLRILRTELKQGNSTLSCVLDKLSITERTLHRKLSNEGTNYTELRDNLITSLSKSYLDNPKMTIEQIAYFLGFSSASSFHRAFKRLTGTSPAKYRADTINMSA